jgi:hypothetical protein
MTDAEDSTVGCSAIVDEAVAPRSFSDVTHSKGCTTGTIGSHKVFVARRPQGSYGILDATSVVVHVAADFPNVRFCLAIDVSGGAPDLTRLGHDIRLGDILRSPANGLVDVIQYEHGKAIHSQPFGTTLRLNRPLDNLLEAAGILSEDYELLGHNLQRMVSQFLDRTPRLLHSSLVHAKPGVSSNLPVEKKDGDTSYRCRANTLRRGQH